MTSASQQYAQLKEQQMEAFLQASFSDEALKDVPLYEVKCPSGMTFKCRKIDGRFQANAGQMPLAVTSSMLTSRGGDVTPAQQEQAYAEQFASMTATEQRAAIQASCQLLRYIAVEPRLVVGEGGANSISVDLLTMADFNYLSKWAAGGDVAEGLKTFRRKRR